MPPKRKAPAASKRKAPAASSQKDEKDGIVEVKKRRGRSKVADPELEEAAAAPAAPVTPNPKPEPDVKAPEVLNELKKSVIIEHCKQCNAFKTRALHVQQYLQKEISGLEVIINPEKPRRGCFEIRDSEGKVFISLQGMPRPFTKLKALDLDETAAGIVEQLK